MKKHQRLLGKAILMIFAVTLVLSGCGTGENSEAGNSEKMSGPSYSKTDSDITVSLVTDKESYKEGEEIHYILTVENGRTGYTVSRVFATASNAEELAEENAPSFDSVIKEGESMSYEGTLLSASMVENPGTTVKQQLPNTVETVTLRPYVNINYGDETLVVRYIVEVVMYQNKMEVGADEKKSVKTVTCHDPSIVVGTDKEGKKCYYIFGSHRAWAKSYDLENWTAFSNNLSTDYRTILAEPAAWSAHGSSNYKVDGYMWAPDVIYNEAMGKWCMYLSVDGDYWYSSIVLLTADELEGDWTYEGIVVYSGFRTDEFYDETDVAKATGETTYPSRYKDKTWGNFYPNNIDACVFYDDDNNLWMSYGSWSGGIFMLQLDENTGLRDYGISYEDNIHSDPYFGTKIAGGQYVSGEASYIQKIGDYYWLFMSYGNLEAKGGYNVRVYRSTRPDGDYVDEMGNSPYFDVYEQNYNTTQGVRLFGGYKWRNFSQGQVAQGHNSAFVDDDGKAYIVFHTRTTDGTEGHYVKVHQLFVNKEGWLVAAPYRTGGESLNETGYSVSEVAGKYDVILHNLNIDYKGLEVNKPVTLNLNEDGTITGDMEGSWSLEEGTPYVNISVNGFNYSGVNVIMEIENTTIKTMTFTALGLENQLTIWGSKCVD